MNQLTSLKPDIIDIDAIVKSGNSKLLNSLPKFVIKKLKKIIHQDELNNIHSKYWEIVGFEYVEGLIKEFGVKLKYKNIENIDTKKRYIFVANHPQGGLDAISYLYTIHKLQGDVVSPSNELFEYIPNLSPFIIGVNVFGKSNKDKAKIITDTFTSNRPIMIFPAGEVSRKNKKGIIEDNIWQKAFVSKAIETKRDIVPCHISGRNSEKFYRISKWRNFFGIKTFIETAYLPDEMIKQFGSEITFTFGEPIPYSSLDKSKTHKEWAAEIRQSIYKLNK